MKKVRLVNNPEGTLITPSTKTPGWGTIQVQQQRVTFSNGILNNSNRTAFIRGKVDDLTTWIDAEGLGNGSEIDGTIIVTETTEPQWENHEPKCAVNDEGNPTHILKCNGLNIYRSTEFFEEGSDVQDVLIQHDEKVEISVSDAVNAGA